MKLTPALCSVIAIAFAACSKGGGGNPGGGNPGGGNPGGNNGNVTITSTSPAYVFWGEEVTITGTGFSTTVNDNVVYFKGNQLCSSDTTWQKGTVTSASSTQLKVKVPFITKSNGVLCGHDWARVRVTVGGKSVTRDEAVKFVGPPVIGLCHPYGVTIGEYPNTYRTGDSSVMTAHLWTLYGRESGYYDKIKLYINGTLLNTVDRYWSGATCGGLTFVLDPSTYAAVSNCTVPSGYGGGPARKFSFIAKVDGTNYADTTECYVFNQPKTTITGTTGSTNVSKSAGGNPAIEVKGKHMFFTQIRWTNSMEATFHTAEAPSLSATSISVGIPLSLMVANRTYTATGIGPCGSEVNLFNVTIAN